MNCIRRTCLVLLFALAFNRGHAQAELAQPPLSQRIDVAIAAAHFGELAQTSTDEEFLRRVYLDLVGRSPSRSEARAFLANGDASKRAETVNRLLASAEFNQYFASVLDVILMERRDGTRIPQADWLSFLQKAVADEWSYDKIVQAILTADGTGEARGAAKFLIQREVEANALTRDVGRIFLGRDLQCAQCHDHPNIVDYEQAEYFGILSFVDRSYLFEDGADNQKSYVGEKAEGEAEYKSVFSPDDDPSQSRPHLLSGLALDVEPRFDGDNAYVVAPTKKSAGLPKFSRRAQLARLITHPANEHFAKNTVNRLWKHMMGRGLVDPVDFHHSDNPPSHPALLKLVADEFVSTGFDIRELLRQIANSETYQRSVDFPRAQLPTLTEIDQRIAQLDSSIEELSTDDQESDADTECRGRLARYRKRVARLDASIDAASKQLKERDQNRNEKTKAVADLQQKLTARKTQLVALKEAVVAAKKVAEAIGNEPSLSDATAEYQRRADLCSKEIESGQNQLAERIKSAEAIAAEVQQLKRRLAKLRSERIGLVDMVAEARGALGVVQARQQQRRASINEQQQHRAALLIQRQLASKLRSKSEAKQQLAKLEEAKLTIDEDERESLTQAIGSADQRIAERRSEVAALTRAMADVKAALADRQRRSESLELAMSESKSANLKLNDPQVTAAVTTMAKSLHLLGERVAAGRLAVADHAQRLAAATSEVEQQCAARDQLIERQKGYAEQRAEIELEMKAARERLDLVNAEAELADTRLRRSLEQRFVVRSIVPLSPEQLAGSTVAALELKPRFQREAEGEWDKLHEGQSPQEVDFDKKAAEIGKLVQKRVDSVVRTYVSMFAAPGGSPQDVFSATADQALFLSNDGRVQGWLSPSEESLISRLSSMKDPATLAEELHLAILSRSASKEEVEEVTVYLQRRADDRNKAIRELAWGLLTSLEFRFNH